MQIDQTTLLALIALVVSVCGFLVSIWSAVISHKALNHNRNSYEEQQRIAFERERSQLLEIFNDSRKLLDKTRIEIGALKAQFDAEPETVKALLVELHRICFQNIYQSLKEDYFKIACFGMRLLVGRKALEFKRLSTIKLNSKHWYITTK